MSIEMRAENESTSALTVIMSISRLSFAPRRVNIELSAFVFHDAPCGLSAVFTAL